MRHKQANIELRIEELVLHDLPHDQRHRVAAAIEQALVHLLTEREVPTGYETGDMPPIEAATVHVNPNLTAESMGLQVAHAIYGQMGSVPSHSSQVSARTNPMRSVP